MNVWRIALLGIMVFWLGSLEFYETKHYDSQIDVFHYTDAVFNALEITTITYIPIFYEDSIYYKTVQLISYKIDPKDKLTRNPRDSVQKIWAD